MSKDRRKNSRRPANPLKGSPAITLDPMEQRNARRIKLEDVGKQVLDRLAVVQDTLAHTEPGSGVSTSQLHAEKQALKDAGIGILSQLIKL